MVFGIGLAVHGAAIWMLHDFKIHPLSGRSPPIVSLQEVQNDLFARKRRTMILSEIVENLRETKPEVKHEFHELNAEYAPSLEISFGEFSTEPDLQPFAYKQEIRPTLAPSKELILGEETHLIAKAPHSTQSEVFPLAEVEYEDDPYLSFGTLAGSEHFDIEVEYAQKRSRPGYVFKVSFYPKEEIIFKRIRQNVYFLIDRSNSIPRARYQLNKRAVSEALAYLNKGDTFNILIFDDNVVRLSPEPLPYGPETVSEARAFLERHGHGGHFAATELYASLGKIIPQNVSDHEVNTAILLSDGDTFLSREKQRLMIGQWTKLNKGKVCLYSVASGTGNNLPLLDLISSFNQGKLIYSHDHKELNSMLVNLINAIQAPIGKEMTATSVVADKQTFVLLQPKAVRLPHLFQHRPFVVYGSTNRLDDFVLFLQGKYYDRRFDIKKKISFEKARQGSFAIEKKWTELLAHEYYARYFDDGNSEHLKGAKQLLVPLNIPTPWID